MKTIFCDGLTEPRFSSQKYSCCAFVAFEGDVDGTKPLAELPKPITAQHACIARPGQDSTNNIAEYRAVRAALNWLVAKGEQDEVELRTDSQLVVRQISGAYACNKDHLRVLRDDCRVLLEKLPNVRIVWVAREQNIPADELTNVAYAEARQARAA
jgi:ribonuclease HI